MRQRLQGLQDPHATDQHKVTVEHVHVEPGDQVIVCNVDGAVPQA